MTFKTIFEYKSVSIQFPTAVYDVSTFEALLNSIGADGWELVTLTPTLHGAHALDVSAIFKRETRVPA